MRERVVIQLFRKPHVLNAVLSHRIYFSFLPPLHCREAVAFFAFPECRFGKRLEPDAPSKYVVDLGQKIKRWYFREIARVVTVQERNIKCVGIVADKEIGLF